MFVDSWRDVVINTVHISERPVRISARRAVVLKRFSLFYSVHPDKCLDRTGASRSRQLPFTLIPLNSSLLSHSFDAMQHLPLKRRL